MLIFHFQNNLVQVVYLFNQPYIYLIFNKFIKKLPLIGLNQMELNYKKIKSLLSKSASMSQQFNNLKKNFQQENFIIENPQKKEIKKQVGILEQFKTKYDQLRKDNQEKRKQIDDLKRQNKRIQIQLFNTNTSFFDGQIKRLRAQLQKSQEVSEDFRLKYIQIINIKNQLQFSLNAKEQQFTTTIKQLQFQKVQGAQLKLQLKQNQINFLKIIAKVEQSNSKLIQKYTECQKKLSEKQDQVQKIKKQLESEAKKSEELFQYKKELENQMRKQSEKYRLQIGNFSKLLEETGNRSIEYRKQIFELKEQVLNLNLQLTKSRSLLDFQNKKIFEKITQFRAFQNTNFQVIKIKQKSEDLENQIQAKNAAYLTLRNRLLEAEKELQTKRQQYEEKIHNLECHKFKIINDYQSKIILLNQQNQILKFQSKKLRQILNKPNHNSEISRSFFIKKTQTLASINTQHKDSFVSLQAEFQHLLRNQDNEINLLSQTLHQKIEQIFQLKQKLQDLHIENEKNREEIKILNQKILVQGKNLKSRNQIEIMEIRSQLQISRQKLLQTETSVRAKIREIKEKDSFIINSVIGKIYRQQDVTLVIAQMQRILQTDFIQKLEKAESKIKVLQKKLNQFQTQMKV